MSTNGGTFDATLAFGAGFDDGRGHVSVYVGYRKINPVNQATRYYSACALSAYLSAPVSAGGLLFPSRVPATSLLGTLFALYPFCLSHNSNADEVESGSGMEGVCKNEKKS